jgi:YVTN family beta-propeller protein
MLMNILGLTPFVYALNINRNTDSIIDKAINNVIKTVNVGYGPQGIVVT